MNYDMGSDEVDDDILITTAEADVIQTILDNDQSRKTNTPAIKTVSDPSPQISAKAASVQNSLAKQNSTKEKVAAIQKILGLHRHTKLDVAVSQTVSDQGKFGTIQKRAGQENPAAFQRETDHANVAAAQKPAGPTNAAAFQNVPDQEKLAAIQKLAGLANAEEFQKILDPEEADTFHKVLDQCGYSELMEILENSHNAWRDSTIKIAITGESGSGKSSFINALCGRKDDEPGAAHTDCIEGTMEPTPYPHPSNENLVLWDLPGVGTPNFPKETYIEDACFDEYDFIILVSCTRYTNNDTWLAEQITSHFPGANLIFVRTKVDNDLQSKRKGRKVPMSEDEIKKVFNIIKQDCYDKLKKAKIENPRVFLVDNHDQSNFEFSNLADMLVDKVSILKKEALVMTIASFSPNIVTAKYEMSKKRLKNISKQAAVAAVKSNRENGERLEMNILIEEVLLYKQQFGIDTTSLDIVAQRFGIDLEEVYIKMDSETHVILRRFEQYYIDHDKVTTQYDSFPWYR